MVNLWLPYWQLLYILGDLSIYFPVRARRVRVPGGSKFHLEPGTIVGIHMIVSDLVFMMYFGYDVYRGRWWDNCQLGNSKILQKLELYFFM